MKPGKHKWHKYGKWQEMGLLGHMCITWVRMDFPKVREHEKYKEIHGKTLGNKWVFKKEKVDFGPKDPGLICRLAGVQGGNFETVGRWKQVGGESP